MPFALVGLITLLLWLFCLIDLVTCDESRIRGLPKVVWLLLIVLLPMVGPILWLVAGRPPGPVNYVGGYSSRRATRSRFGEYGGSGRQIVLDPKADEDFLKRCRERAEAQRREWRRQQREAGEG